MDSRGRLSPHRGIQLAGGFALAPQEVPGFLVFAVLGFFQVGREDYRGLVSCGADGEDVPGVGGDDVGGDDVGGDEVELRGAVGDVGGADGADVGVLAFADGAFDLDAAEASAVVGGEVVGGGVSPGLGDAEAEFGGAGHETQFGPLSTRLGVADVHPFIFHWFNAWTQDLIQAIKNAAWEGRVGYLSLYIYSINPAGVKRHGLGKYIWLGWNGLGEIGADWGLDKKLGRVEVCSVRAA